VAGAGPDDRLLALGADGEVLGFAIALLRHDVAENDTIER
jgi:hypothetical protein